MFSTHDFGVQTGNHPLTEGMAVFDVDGEHTRTLKRGEPDHGCLQVRRGRLFGRDYYLPRALIVRVNAEGIHINIRNDELNAYDRRSPYPSDRLDELVPTTATSGALPCSAARAGQQGSQRRAIMNSKLAYDVRDEDTTAS